MNPSSVATVLSNHNILDINSTWNTNQIYYLSKRDIAVNKKLTSNASSSTELNELFEKPRDDVSYLYITFHPSDGLILLTGKDRTRRLLEMRKNIDVPPTCNVQSIWDDSKLGSEGRLLVIFLYASKEELHLLRMYPEICAVDTTFGTNVNKKELFTVVGKDANNNEFNGARAYIPDAQRRTFNLLFKE